MRRQVPTLSTKSVPGFDAFDLLPDAVFQIDPARMALTGANSTACDRLGYPRQQLLCLPLSPLFVAADLESLPQQFDAAQQQPATATLRTVERCSDGRTINVEWHVSRICDGNGERWMIVSRIAVSAHETPTVNAVLGESYGLGMPGHDPLTGLPDRRLFERRLGRAVDRARQHQDYLFAVYFIDLDDFKTINDNWGHRVGDQVLCEVARRMVICLRPGDMVARFGGDEFTVFLDDLHDPSEATVVARRILDQLERPLLVEEHPIQLKASIGVATSAHAYQQANDLIHHADLAMYRVKASGGSDLRLFAPDLTIYPPTP